jgi:hypothetical protein
MLGDRAGIQRPECSKRRQARAGGIDSMEGIIMKHRTTRAYETLNSPTRRPEEPDIPYLQSEGYDGDNHYLKMTNLPVTVADGVCATQ